MARDNPRGRITADSGPVSNSYPVLRSSPDFYPPITVPGEEKRVFEARSEDGLMEHLRGAVRAGGIVVPPGELETRIAEIYRRCFEDGGGADLNVVSDFVAHCPRFVLRGCPWLAGLAASPIPFGAEILRATTNRPSLTKQRLLDAIAKGFERAAAVKSEKAQRRAIAPSISGAARLLRENLAERLRTHFADWQGWASGEWLTEESMKLLSQLKREYPRIKPGDVETLQRHLAGRHAFEAAVIIAARSFGVSTRDVRGNRRIRE